ncbi:N-acetylmuramic acid 6-phosphate etherase [Paraburkholderia sp. LEh10]|uniref:N-acetylmuramic acid 6-phosphate etherase n=1 Tax=Paraburkholderia sp. LEh10 TaxID=2821353 RepID=UPI001AE963E1|nr:N-acetylmuramic acid 6-phosphate etherase [Paraburkholderia sp. LEh10]MBP0592993.1 N-acetylmuramic acid 6-phosphate etherase [Paraburkholderia sp. LEh10]
MQGSTEIPHPQHTDLDLYPIDRLVEVLVEDQLNAAQAVWAVRDQLTEAVREAIPRIAAGGRLIYVGAGTSGRLGMLDAVELYPTFSWPRSRAIALIAGGPGALTNAVEGAEDDGQQGEADLLAVRPLINDVVLAIAASGSTPYVLGALRAARAIGSLTIGLANNPNAPVLIAAQIGIALVTGPEIISGSTRLKAGTAQKIALNSFSSALMVGLNKVYGNLMVDLRPVNAKLMHRAISMTMHATGVSEDIARSALVTSGYQVKVAIVVLKCGVDAEAARARLAATGGNVRQALDR